MSRDEPTTNELRKKKRKKHRRKRRGAAPVSKELREYRKLALAATRKLEAGGDLNEDEIIALFKSDNLQSDVLDDVIDQLSRTESADALLTDFRHVEEPVVATDFLSVWCPNVEKEMLEYFRRHPEHLYVLEPRRFEELVAAIFSNNGFSVELTPRTRDGGVDIIAVDRSPLVGDSVHLIECKRYAPERTVGIGVVQRLLGTVTQQRANKGVIVTTSYFSKEATSIAENTSYMLTLRDYSDVLSWLRGLRLMETEKR